MGGQPRVRVEICRTGEFKAWYLEQAPKTRVVVDARLERVHAEGYFGATACSWCFWEGTRMGRTGTSAVRRKSSGRSSKPRLERHNVYSAELKDPKLVREVLVEALMANDLATFQDVLIAHLRAAPKSKLAARTGLGRQTLYDLIDESKDFNPTLSTLGAILKGIAA